MKKILITGATDGIGLETSKKLASLGHHLLIHGRNSDKLESLKRQLKEAYPNIKVDAYQADFSLLSEVNAMISQLLAEHESIDVLLNNAGVYNVREAQTSENLDRRFVVNTISPYLLAKRLLPIITNDGRIINVASAAQASLNLDFLATVSPGSDGSVYAQSKLAMIMWTNAPAASLGENGPVVVSLNPKSFLGSKMVKQAYGMAGADLSIGADILTRAALSDEFASASGKYFDNDIEQFGTPHQDALNPALNQAVMSAIENIIEQFQTTKGV